MFIPYPLSITFGGELAERFGYHHLWWRQGPNDTIPDAIRAIATNQPTLVTFLIQCTDIGTLFSVELDGGEATEFDLASALGSERQIHIEPIPSGSGGNILKGVLGVALLGIGLLTMGGALGVGGLIFGIKGTTLALAGAATIASALFAPNTPKVVSPVVDSKESRKSTYFNQTSIGATDSVIPRLYGSCVHENGNTFTALGYQCPVLPISINLQYSLLNPDDN